LLNAGPGRRRRHAGRHVLGDYRAGADHRALPMRTFSTITAPVPMKTSSSIATRPTLHPG